MAIFNSYVQLPEGIKDHWMVKTIPPRRPTLVIYPGDPRLWGVDVGPLDGSMEAFFAIAWRQPEHLWTCEVCCCCCCRRRHRRRRRRCCFPLMCLWRYFEDTLKHQILRWILTNESHFWGWQRSHHSNLMKPGVLRAWSTQSNWKKFNLGFFWKFRRKTQSWWFINLIITNSILIDTYYEDI